MSNVVPFGQKHSYPIAVSLHLSVQRCSCVSHSFFKISIKQKYIYISNPVKGEQNISPAQQINSYTVGLNIIRLSVWIRLQNVDSCLRFYSIPVVEKKWDKYKEHLYTAYHHNQGK